MPTFPPPILQTCKRYTTEMAAALRLRAEADLHRGAKVHEDEITLGFDEAQLDEGDPCQVASSERENAGQPSHAPSSVTRSPDSLDHDAQVMWPTMHRPDHTGVGQSARPPCGPG